MVQFLVTWTTNLFKDGVTCQIKVEASNKIDAAIRAAEQIKWYETLYPGFLYSIVSAEPIR